MAAIVGSQFRTLAAAFHHQKLNIGCNQILSLLQVRNYAARKGTRERARKKKTNLEVKKVEHHFTIKKKNIVTIPFNAIRKDDKKKSEAIDDVWIARYHKWRIYSFDEAVKCHRETHHPTCFNLPNALISARVELNMKGDKNKIIEKFTRTVTVPHIFDHGEKRSVLALAKTPELLQLAEDAGASMVGNAQLIHKIQAGELSVDRFSAIVAHPEILADLSVIRGLLKRKYPNVRVGTLGLNLPEMIKRIKHGIEYTAIPHEQQILYGLITVPIGRLPMHVKHLEENLIKIIKDVEAVRPKRDGEFIMRVTLTSPRSKEMLKINFEQYLQEGSPIADNYESDDEEEFGRSNVVQ